MIPIEVPTHVHVDFCVDYVWAYHAPFGHDAKCRRQTDRAVGIDYNCNSIGGLKCRVDCVLCC